MSSVSAVRSKKTVNLWSGFIAITIYLACCMYIVGHEGASLPIHKPQRGSVNMQLPSLFHSFINSPPPFFLSAGGFSLPYIIIIQDAC